MLIAFLPALVDLAFLHAVLLVELSHKVRVSVSLSVSIDHILLYQINISVDVLKVESIVAHLAQGLLLGAE